MRTIIKQNRHLKQFSRDETSFTSGFMRLSRELTTDIITNTTVLLLDEEKIASQIGIKYRIPEQLSDDDNISHIYISKKTRTSPYEILFCHKYEIVPVNFLPVIMVMTQNPLF